jgi:SAM-dependent methyltransferase
LELGCGGGHNAFYLKEHFRMKLTDIAPAMLDLSRRLNPACEHLPGDMRTLRLERQFDAVLIQDAIGYMTTKADLAAALRTAFVHCAPGGVALFCPDFVKETFHPGATHGGADGDGRALRYLEWTWDADPGDDRYQVDFAYLLREGTKVRAEYDHHTLGLFPRGEWERLILDAGFEFSVESYELRQAPEGSCGIFVGRKV